MSEETQKLEVVKVELYITNHDHVSHEEISSILENTKYPNRCITPHVSRISTTLVDWHDRHPTNLISEMDQAYNDLFKSEWIDVNEAMPEDGQKVFVTTDNNLYIAVHMSGNFYYDNSYFGNYGNVIAWMPLPEPYDPKKKEDVNDYTVGNPFWLKDEIKEGCNYRLVFGDIVDFYAVNDTTAEIHSDTVSDGKSYALYKLDEGKLKIYKIHNNDHLE